uniref:Uncharacterized protein n=1 Tax=Thermosporothrix sp. COM3 TaxID=2490863 RepID=A0A455T026_9CHLR|nr:hypothetical protein KTC_64960 [Thermosporothrix sp. COM3]
MVCIRTAFHAAENKQPWEQAETACGHCSPDQSLQQRWGREKGKRKEGGKGDEQRVSDLGEETGEPVPS